MNEQHDSFDRRPGPDGERLADRNNREERLHRALTVLRRFSDWRNNPQPLRATISRVRREAETYRRWLESGAHIRDVVLRLADGREITVEKDKTIDANMFTFGFSWLFPPGAVLHVYKKPDDEFGEVLLLTVELSRVAPTGYNYSKTFDNGQSFALNVIPAPKGVFDVNVNYSMQPGRSTTATSGGRFAWLPAIGPAFGTLTAAGALFGSRPRRRYGLAYSIVLVAVTAVAMTAVRAYFSDTGDIKVGAPIPMTGELQPSAPKAVTPPDAAEGQARQDPSAGLVAGGAKTNRDPRQVTQPQPPFSPQRAHSEAALEGLDKDHGVAGLDWINRRNAATDPDGSTFIASSSKTPSSCPASKRGPYNQPPAAGVATSRPQQLGEGELIPIYVKASMTDERLTTDMQKALVAELKKTNRFRVMTYSAEQPIANAYEVSVWYLPETGCYGKIFYQLYDANGPQIGEGEHNCREFPKGKVLQEVSRIMASEVLTQIDGARQVASRS